MIIRSLFILGMRKWRSRKEKWSVQGHLVLSVVHSGFLSPVQGSV